MRTVFIAALAIIAFSCGSKEKAASKDGAPAADAPKYPYTIDKPDNWEVGSSANTMTVLSALKAFEDKKMDESVSYFADSIRVMFDGFDKTITRDSLKALLVAQSESMKSLRIKMEDWESVISKDKSEEWVTIWYKEYMESMDGVQDSVSIINDLKIKSGKIERIAEYTRKLH